MSAGPGLLAVRLASTALALVLSLVPALGPGPVPGPAAANPAAAASYDYTAGPFAGRLCGTGPGHLVCSVTRLATASVQGFRLRSDAVAQGATCEVQSGLWVCFGIESLLAQRGGTTYGDTFLTPRAHEMLDAGLIAHEREHVRQWRLFGRDFSLMYLLEGTDPCTNYFEIAAGLDAGGYVCP